MKHLVTTMFCLLLSAIVGTANAQKWEELETNIDEDLYDVHCIDASTIIVCGQNGVILKSEDGGNNWQEVFRDEGNYLCDIHFVDNLTGFAYGNFLVKTTDGGNSWVRVDTQYPRKGNFSDAKDLGDYLNTMQIYALDADTLYFVSESMLYKSTDGGATASCVLQGYPNYWPQNGNTWWLFFEDQVGYFAYQTYELVVYKTTDYGNSWKRVFEISNSNTSILLHYLDKDNVDLFTAPAYEQTLSWLGDNVLCTEDGFTSTFSKKSYTDNEVYAFFRDFKFTSQNNGCYIARTGLYGGYCYSAFTNDGGTHWTYCADGLDTTLRLNGVGGIDTFYFLAADNGIVYRTKRNTDNIHESSQVSVSIFPNPVKETLEIDAKNAKALEIIDLAGRIVFDMPLYQDHVSVDCSKLDAGIYFVVMTDHNNQRQIKKMVKSN